METKKLFFTSDVYYGKDLAYKGGQTAEVPVSMVDRWLKRGAIECPVVQTNVPVQDEEISDLEQGSKKVEDVLKSVHADKRKFKKR
jgi:hypothetical protein